jgi:hypothetical protein
MLAVLTSGQSQRKLATAVPETYTGADADYLVADGRATGFGGSSLAKGTCRAVKGADGRRQGLQDHSLTRLSSPSLSN